MWKFHLSRRSKQNHTAGDAEQNHGGQRRKLPKLKNLTKFWTNHREQEHKHTEDREVDLVEEQEEQEELLEVSRRLITREEQLMIQDCSSEEEETSCRKTLRI
ncbi:hypothetical protein INR49_006844 [Caranx melampygus]|nr:hypothetical protein INR49_006844 [Caranx melampygus]